MEAGIKGCFQVLDGILEDNFAFVANDDAGANLFDNYEDVGTEEDYFAFVGKDFEEATEEESGVDVETGEGFIEDEKFGVVEEGRGALAGGIEGDGTESGNAVLRRRSRGFRRGEFES